MKEVEEFKRSEEAKKLESKKDDLSIGKDKKQSGKVEISRDTLEPKKDL